MALAIVMLTNCLVINTVATTDETAMENVLSAVAENSTTADTEVPAVGGAADSDITSEDAAAPSANNEGAGAAIQEPSADQVIESDEVINNISQPNRDIVDESIVSENENEQTTDDGNDDEHSPAFYEFQPKILNISLYDRATAKSVIDELQCALDCEQISQSEYDDLSDEVYRACNGDPYNWAEDARGNVYGNLLTSDWYLNFVNQNPVQTDTKIQEPASTYSITRTRQAAIPDTAAETPASNIQIDNYGGATTNDDGVTVSKTISGTSQENIFDITLSVNTSINIEEIYKEPDMAVVIVMDISNTMNNAFPAGNTTGMTRYKAAMNTAKEFLDAFKDNTQGVSTVGFVAFNTDATTILELQPCTDDNIASLKTTIANQTSKIIGASGYSSSTKRFTNIEAGLKLGRDMLLNANNTYKYMILLSDGFPTTYISSGYKGYNPYENSRPNGPVIFYDHVFKVPCTYGTNYSDTAAVKARAMAESAKNNDITIFTIGVDVAGSSVQPYINSSTGKTFSTVERTSTTLEIGSPSDTSAFETWLANKISSGYYYDSRNAEQLQTAYDDIFETILELRAAGSAVEWVTTDPMPVTLAPADTVTFLGFYDQNGDIVDGSLTEESVDNLASYDYDKKSINWDLKKSMHSTTTNGSTTQYFYELTYRVRLNNETITFPNNTQLETNGTTSLCYCLFEEVNGETVLSENKTIDFQIPTVHGWTNNFTFTKQDDRGLSVENAEFTLSHDTNNCLCLTGDATNATTIPDKTALSASDGKVRFTQIPSGHKYVIKETSVPDGYVGTDDTYIIDISYGELSIAKKDSSGTISDWNSVAINVWKVTADIPLLKMSKTENGILRPLGGVNFRLSGVSDYGTKVDLTVTTDDNGKLTFTKIEKGTYSLRESLIPDGYVRDDIIYDVQVKENGALIINGIEKEVVEIINYPTILHIIKRDDDGNILSGAKLRIIDSGGNTIDEWISGSAAHQLVGILNPNTTYTLQETEAPAGYAVAEDVTFTVKNTGAVQEIVMIDRMRRGTLILSAFFRTIEAELYGEPLALFQITGYDATGKYHAYNFALESGGSQVFADLPIGTYTITDIRTSRHVLVEVVPDSNSSAEIQNGSGYVQAKIIDDTVTRVRFEYDMTQYEKLSHVNWVINQIGLN